MATTDSEFETILKRFVQTTINVLNKSRMESYTATVYWECEDGVSICGLEIADSDSAKLITHDDMMEVCTSFGAEKFEKQNDWPAAVVVAVEAECSISFWAATSDNRHLVANLPLKRRFDGTLVSGDPFFGRAKFSERSLAACIYKTLWNRESM